MKPFGGYTDRMDISRRAMIVWIRIYTQNNIMHDTARAEPPDGQNEQTIDNTTTGKTQTTTQATI